MTQPIDAGPQADPSQASPLPRLIKRLLRGVALALAALVAFAGAWYFNLPQHLLRIVGSSEVQARPQSAATLAPSPASLALRVVSANVECFYCEANWDERSASTAGYLGGLAADLIGLQELVTDRDLEAVVPTTGDYELVVPRIFGQAYGDAAILFRASRFELLESGVVWLGRNQGLPLSAGWTVGLPRYVNWVLLRERDSGAELIFVNTHFDPNRPNKDASAPIFHEVVTALSARAPVIATGDFNTCTDAERFAIVCAPPIRDTHAIASAQGGEVDAGGWSDALDIDLIDHVLVAADAVQVVAWRVDDSDPDRSDHPYVMVDLVLGTERASGPSSQD
ncbi:endonuclease/exonuclease/phosphatase family protein [Engelhardtia mirabilis]|uniref:endonuclease/exonuclease/phosphatase family protein n=1 Tax=Engelhardtia mirabilis TaxID=2528011 RepID=UPI0011A37EBE